jgi:phosphomannomutase
MKKYRRGVREIAGFPVTGRADTDGHKFFVEGGWVLVRASGTEPLIRFYAEAESTEKVRKLLEAATAH